MSTYARPKNADSIQVDDIKAITGSAGPGFSQGFKTDTIAELTAAAGVTIDGVLLKDGGVVVDSFSADTISEKTSAAGVTVDSVLLKDGSVTVGTGGSVVTDTIAEKTAATGVTVDGVLLKDGSITVTTCNATNLTSAGFLNIYSASAMTLYSPGGVILGPTNDILTIRTSGSGVTETWQFNGKDLIPIVTDDGQIGSPTKYIKRAHLSRDNRAFGNLSATGTTQGTAAAVTKALTRINSATFGVDDGVILPSTAVTNDIYTLFSTSTTINVYPPSGHQIDALGANVADSLTVTSHFRMYVYAGSSQWYRFV